ncbi:DUF742 domain-containing protein [Rhodococcus sp. HNM0569]|uniref:DUF742 domain-containing protein n=1 Tax=Rhodococcus sp. HNM0569 TaxID=2716340 RepID=UPI00146C3543|nr:DUF742 domain-containing protein [Rhodococcus sp. HNM0569]NLU81313.1 DUF742 domain-containing protein [Rhodococcus sp. HNM0569]
MSDVYQGSDEREPDERVPSHEAAGDWPAVGATGARFGSAGRREKRERSWRAAARAAVRRTAAVVSGGSVQDDAAARTGARTPGSAPVAAPPSPDASVQKADVQVAEPAWTGPIPTEPAPTEPAPAEPAPTEPVPATESKPAESFSLVRPFVRSGGRTDSDIDLQLETLVSVSGTLDDRDSLDEYRRVLEACDRPRSIAEIASLTQLPIGVARVLVGDLAGAGTLVVHRSAGKDGPDTVLIQRVLDGIRRL